MTFCATALFYMLVAEICHAEESSECWYNTELKYKFMVINEWGKGKTLGCEGIRKRGN